MISARDSADEHLYYSVGLAGDGDEVAAIEDVEREFGVTFDVSNAPSWSTAGDVFASLKTALPAEMADDQGIWGRFAVALAGQSGIDPSLIEPGSPLLLPASNFWRGITELAALLWAVLTLIVIGVICLSYFDTL